MIQRQQTLWLILSAFCGFLTFQLPFVTGDRLINGQRTYVEVDAGENFFLLILTGISIIISLIAIFLFKDRKKQIKVCLAGIVVAVLLIIIYILEMQKFEKSTIAMWAVLPFANLFGYIMAYRGIKNDERLVKSLDKLR